MMCTRPAVAQQAKHGGKKLVIELRKNAIAHVQALLTCRPRSITERIAASLAHQPKHIAHPIKQGPPDKCNQNLHPDRLQLGAFVSTCRDDDHGHLQQDCQQEFWGTRLTEIVA
jgi:hypothetical protein